MSDTDADAVAPEVVAGDGPEAVEPVVEEGVRPSDAFQSLGNETRMGVLRSLWAAEADGEGQATRSFSALFEASDADTSAQFAYHLRQLTDTWVEKTDEETYALTYAGRALARAVEAGTFTQRVDAEAVPLSGPCPECGREELTATAADNTLSVGCDACERSLLCLPFPPSGLQSHDPEDLPGAFDRHHRHRLSTLADGVCPECGGAVSTTARAVEGDRVQATLSCDACGYRLRTPATLTVLDHPAVVSFYHEHGTDLRERPLWNVGAEWRETLVSEDPWVLRVSTELDGETLSLFLDASLTPREIRRGNVSAAS